jgi:hypothetical protein
LRALPSWRACYMLMGMGKLKIIISAAVIVCSMLGSSNSLLAQDAQSGPTDSDLKAAYCLSVVQDREATFHPCQQTAPLQSANEFYAKTCHEDQDKIARLKGYLAARGYVFGERDPFPVVVAGDRGLTDSKDCLQSSTGHEHEIGACALRCETQANKAACNDACFPPAESCRRIWSCNDLSFLPF